MLHSVGRESSLRFIQRRSRLVVEVSPMVDALALRALLRRGTAPADAARAEHRRRTLAAAVLVVALFLASSGLAWDIRWHTLVGRDSFWSPPHLLMYGGVALAGLVALGMVLHTSVRYWRRDPALDDGNTVAVFGMFHGPLGCVMAGFGIAVLLLAAPGDNYWHELYGLDVALWAPFHLMGLIAGGIAGLGLLYAVTAEATRARRLGQFHARLLDYSGLDLLALFVASGLLSGLLMIAQPATVLFPTTVLGPLEVLTYPLLVALAVSLMGVACVRFTGRPGSATLMAGLFVLRQVGLGLLLSWATRATVALQGLEYRQAVTDPGFGPFLIATTAALLLPAVAIDLVALWARHRDLSDVRAAALAGGAAALPLFAFGVWLVSYVVQHARALGTPLEFVIPPLPPAGAVWLALPLTLALGALGGALGSGLGAVLRLNQK